MKLSILIPSLVSRADKLNELRENLKWQIAYYGYVGMVEILTHIDNGEMPIGDKRNELLERSRGEYICFIDDDDEVSEYYLDLIMKALLMNPDCCSVKGVYEVDGVYDGIFEHSVKYKSYKTNDFDFPKYERYPNHLNVIKRSIAIQFKFPSINHGEDTDWATQIFKSGLLKREQYIEPMIYHYKFKSNK